MHITTKKRLLLVALIILGFFIFNSIKDRQVRLPTGNKIRVNTSIYPYYFFASEIGGNKVEVKNITPAGSEPHDNEPSTGDIINIRSGSLLVINGVVEPWADKLSTELETTGVRVLRAGEGLFTREYIDEDGHNSVDPHVWINPRLAKVQVETILQALKDIDPDNEKYYSANAKTLVAKLEKLDSEYKTGLKNCKSRDIITSHAAFSYLAEEYNLKQVTIAGLSPDTEPSLKQLAIVADFAKKNNVKYIFFESLVSPKLAETIAREVGAETLILNPLEGLTKEDIDKGENYITVMEQNLQNLRLALECE